jgi:hypothetical protein
MADEAFLYISPKDIYAKCVDANGSVTWPEDPRACKLLARAILGAWLIPKLDGVVREAYDMIDSPESNEENSSRSYTERDEWFRSTLNQLTDKQKQVVSRLILETAYAVLFHSLVTLDQTPNFGRYVLSLRVEQEDGSMRDIQISPHSFFDLHDDLDGWMLAFSRFGDELIKVVKTKHGEQFAPVAPYVKHI